MTKTLNYRRIIACLVAAWLSLPGFAPPVSAQLDLGSFYLIQEGEIAGLLWQPRKTAESCESKELWYLFPNYTYPSLEQPIETVLEVAPDYIFEGEASFRLAMKELFPGGRFVLTVAVEEREECL